MNYQKILEESDERARKRVEKQTKIDIANFDAEKELSYLPIDSKHYEYQLGDKRIRYRQRGKYYFFVRHFPSQECTERVWELLIQKENIHVLNNDTKH